jgi:acetyl esterase/lipase
MSARPHIAACTAVAAVLLASPAAHADPPTSCRPTAIALHGGAFVGRDEMATAARELETAGFRVEQVRYPLHDVRLAYRTVAARARRLRGPVLAVGESAGGTIASWLAARGRVDAAVTVGAPQDLTAWLAKQPRLARRIGLSTAARQWRYSPARIYRRGEGAPLHAFHYRFDLVVSPEQALAMEPRGAAVSMIDGLGHAAPGIYSPHWLDAGGRRILRRQAGALVARCASSAARPARPRRAAAPPRRASRGAPRA